MQKHFSILIATCLYTATALAQTPKDKLNKLMEYYTQNDDFSGTVLIAKKGTVLLDKGYGYSNVGARTPNTENTIYQIGSNTKQFTAEVIVQLDSKGRLGIEDKVSKYMPGFTDGDQVSLKNLLTHTSGIYNYTKETEFTIAHPEKAVSHETILATFKNKPLEFTPGSKFEYSNSNYYLLGCIIEKITGMRYETEVRRNIFNVCGMTHSGFDFTHLRDPNKATGYYYIQSGKNMEAPITDSSISYAAGAIYSTVGDLYKWHQALHTYKLLPKDWQSLPYKPFKNHYAFGWSIDKIDGKEYMTHTGGISGFTSYELRSDPEDIFIVILENNMKPGVDNEAIGKSLLKCLNDPNYKLPTDKSVAVKADVLQAYAGTYQVNADFAITIRANGNELTAQATNQSEIRLKAESQTVFHTVGVAATIEFVKSKDGSCKEIVLRQNGTELTGTR